MREAQRYMRCYSSSRETHTQKDMEERWLLHIENWTQKYEIPSTEGNSWKLMEVFVLYLSRGRMPAADCSSWNRYVSLRMVALGWWWRGIKKDKKGCETKKTGKEKKKKRRSSVSVSLCAGHSLLLKTSPKRNADLMAFSLAYAYRSLL